MSFASLNKTATMKPGVSTKDMEFEALKDFTGKKLILNGFFFTTGKYGKAAAVHVTDENGVNHLVNTPGWACCQFEKIADNAEMISEMFNGKCALVNIETKDTGKGNPTTTFEFADV